MRKILFTCDTANFPKGAFEFANTLYQQEPFLLTGMFMHSVAYEDLHPVSLASNPDPVVAFTNTDVQAVQNSVQLFSEKCTRNGIEFRVHEEGNHFKIRDVIKETRFADLLMLSGEVFFSHLDAEQPNIYLQQLMHETECPVLLVPENPPTIKNIIAAYDGKKESMFAIKQFCYMFPQFTSYPLTIIYESAGDELNIPDLEYLEEYATRHFSSLTIEKLQTFGKSYQADWLKRFDSSLFVAGSYRHTGFLTPLRNHFIDNTIRQHRAIIFVAHNS